jgi:hypothetical protein
MPEASFGCLPVWAQISEKAHKNGLLRAELNILRNAGIAPIVL